MPQYNFGIGKLTLTPPAGSPDITPADVGVVQDVSLDVAFTTKELRGANIFPVDIGRGSGKISGKAKHGQINGTLIQALLVGASLTTPQETVGVFSVSTGVIAGASFDTTAGINFVDDLGVFDATGVALKKVTAAPAAGQYAVSATGVYTFNAASNGATYTISYSRKDTAAGSKSIDYNNQLMGNNTVFQLTLYNSFRAKSFGIKLYAVVVPKLSFAFKNEDYMDIDLDFEAFADAAGNVIDFYTAE